MVTTRRLLIAKKRDASVLQNCLILHFDSRCIYPLFFRKVVEIERFALRGQNEKYLLF